MNNIKEAILSPTTARILGLARAAFFGYLTYEVYKYGLDNNSLRIPALTLGSIFTLDGLVDVARGEWHCLFDRNNYLANRRQKQKNAS